MSRAIDYAPLIGRKVSMQLADGSRYESGIVDSVRDWDEAPNVEIFFRHKVSVDIIDGAEDQWRFWISEPTP